MGYVLPWASSGRGWRTLAISRRGFSSANRCRTRRSRPVLGPCRSIEHDAIRSTEKQLAASSLRIVIAAVRLSASFVLTHPAHRRTH